MAAALAANSEIFQFRWPEATNLALIHRVSFAAGANVAASAASLFSIKMIAARAWTVAGTGGTRLTMTGNNGKLRTSMGTSLVNDIGIATTAALTSGTKVLDAQDIRSLATGITTGAITTSSTSTIFALTDLYNSSENLHHPLVLAQNDGFILRSGNIAPAAMTWHFTVSVMWQEVLSY